MAEQISRASAVDPAISSKSNFAKGSADSTRVVGAAENKF